ncbi:MAG: ZIP family metal transporter [Alphaproteobacteria bacterium]
MDPLLIEAIYIVVIAAAGLIGGFAPGRLSGDRAGGGLELGNAFAGGIFTGAGLLHLLADSGENFESALPDAEFPVALLGAGIGILVILAFDQFSRVKASENGPKGRAVILFLVLSIHSIIAGAALGIESATGAGIAIFIAIIAHKSAAGFALGIALQNEAATTGRLKRTIIAFSVMTPLGIVLGVVLENVFEGPAHFVWEGSFDALAAGTFLYVALCEILPETFSSSRNRAAKVALVTAGFVLMAAIAVWA